MKTKNFNTAHSRSYINNIPVRDGELTIVTSDSAEDTLVHSAKLAASAQQAGVPALLINCTVSRKRFTEYFNANHEYHNTFPQLITHSSMRGELIREKEMIEQIVQECRVGLVVLTGWEWTADSWRKKQKVLFFLRKLMDLYSVTIVVYSHCYNAPEPGVLDKGGVGKLALHALFVAQIDASVELERAKPMPPPLVATAEEEAQAVRSAQLLASRINGLEGESEWSVGSGQGSVKRESGVQVH
jgi:hypothetical protein